MRAKVEGASHTRPLESVTTQGASDGCRPRLALPTPSPRCPEQARGCTWRWPSRERPGAWIGPTSPSHLLICEVPNPRKVVLGAQEAHTRVQWGGSESSPHRAPIPPSLPVTGPHQGPDLPACVRCPRSPARTALCKPPGLGAPLAQRPPPHKSAQGTTSVTSRATVGTSLLNTSGQTPSCRGGECEGDRGSRKQTLRDPTTQDSLSGPGGSVQPLGMAEQNFPEKPSMRTRAASTKSGVNAQTTACRHMPTVLGDTLEPNEKLRKPVTPWNCSCICKREKRVCVCVNELKDVSKSSNCIHWGKR